MHKNTTQTCDTHACDTPYCYIFLLYATTLWVWQTRKASTICINKFQNLAQFNNPLLFQQRLRASWQHHKHVIIDVFQNKRRLFYNFGGVMFLDKISTKHWIDFICKQFEATKKKISHLLATEIVKTVKMVSNKTLGLAINDLLKQSNMFFNREVEHLSNTQISFLKALSKGVQNFHSMFTLEGYKLGSSSNVTGVKEALEKKEIN